MQTLTRQYVTFLKSKIKIETILSFGTCMVAFSRIICLDLHSGYVLLFLL